MLLGDDSSAAFEPPEGVGDEGVVVEEENQNEVNNFRGRLLMTSKARGV